MLPIILLLVFVAYAAVPNATAAPDVECTGTDWALYKDLKCFKVIKKFSTKAEAVNLCAKEHIAASDASAPTLVAIQNADEQEFLTKFIYNTSEVKVNVWLSGKRNPTKTEEFQWGDSIGMEFSNWIETSGPTKQKGRDCVEMLSKLTIEDPQKAVDGKWEDVTCELANYVVCQKSPIWSLAKLQQTMLEVRKFGVDSHSQLVSTQNELTSTKTQLTSTQTQLTSTQTQLTTTQNQLTSTQTHLTETQSKLSSAQSQITRLQDNPVPIGFIYTQLGGQYNPNSIWPAVTWTDVTSNYGGLFFRAEGGNSASFGQVQSDNSPRLSQISTVLPADQSHFINFYANSDRSAYLHPGQWSGDLYTGASGGEPKDGFNFYTSGGEVRPYNMAIKIWKRTA